jgi:hypothetical protein
MTAAIRYRDTQAGRGKANAGAETNTLRRYIVLWRAMADEDGQYCFAVAL